MNRSEIAERFLKLEKQKNLLNFQVDNTYAWQMSRVWLFLEILIFFENISSDNQTSSSFGKIFNTIKRIILNSVFKNPFFDFRNTEILIFQSSRKYFFNDIYIDIYTHYITEKFNANTVTLYETVCENFDNNFSFDFKSKIKHLDFLRICIRLVQIFIRPKFTKQELLNIKDLENEVHKEFGANLSILELFNNSIKQFRAESLVYDFLFWMKKPKEIYIVGSSDKAALIFSAKKKKIVVNELQHGFNSDKDVIFNYPYTPEDSLLYFPNRFFVWNNVQMFFAKLPLSQQNIFQIPNYHLELMLNDTKNITKEEKAILIISQPFGSDDIFNFVIRNISELADFKIYYKIHPVESKSEKFEKLKCFTNVIVIDNQESIYILMRKSKFVLGIYSSALYEAVAFNCAIILLDLPGVEMSINLLENSNCKLADTQSSLRPLLTT